MIKSKLVSNKFGDGVRKVNENDSKTNKAVYELELDTNSTQ